MYKNFKLTEEERKQIIEMHESHGYKKPINEFGEKEIEIIRGNPDIKSKTGRPSGDYLDKTLAAKQFQQDFKKEFPDPADEPVPFWEKDKARPSGESEIEADIKRDSKQGDFYTWLKRKESDSENPMDKSTQERSRKEERLKLRRRIASLVSHKEEFGGDEELDRLIERLRAQAMEMDENR